ncbi:hypothetical protein BD770DRAFT_387451 [Pilaira anomala]|nr:hypothetical protein BD770DRAFT_387451 [Pilaira anomala]
MKYLSLYMFLANSTLTKSTVLPLGVREQTRKSILSPMAKVLLLLLVPVSLCPKNFRVQTSFPTCRKHYSLCLQRQEREILPKHGQ